MSRIIDLIKKEKLSVIFAVASFAICISWSLYTNQIWEDFFITYQHSRNLIEGNGLVFTPGEKVHGFTSPLGVLLPAVCGLISGPRNYETAIWLFRLLFCIPAFTMGGILLMKCFRQDGKDFPLPAVFAGILYLLEAKSVAFSLNGMETSLMLLFLAWTFYIYRRGFTLHWVAAGIAWAGLMWTRPDSFIYVGAIVAAGFFFRDCKALKYIINTVKAGLVTTLLYLPWFIWAWVYYGSPIPNTVIAKSALTPHQDLMAILWKALSSVISIWGQATAPTYFIPSSWPPYIAWFCTAFAITAFAYWTFVFVNDRFGRMVSLVFFFTSFYLSSIPLCYPWYLPPMALAGTTAVISAVSSLTDKFIKDKQQAKKTLLFFYIFMTVSFAMIILMTGYMEKIRQTVADDGTRKQIGLWLKANTNSSDRIYLECLGYIGYFAERKMLDYPGLATPEVTKVIKEDGRNFQTVPEKLKPEWIVLRYFESEKFKRNKYFTEQYTPAAEFNSLGFSNLYGYIPGENNIYYDSWFIVYKRK